MPTFKERISALPRLSAATSKMTTCKICGSTACIFDIVDFNKLCDEAHPYYFGISGVDVTYFKCEECEFIFTRDFDDWSKQDFKRFIYNEDYIRVDGDYPEARPQRLGDEFSQILSPLRDEISILDFGSGSGVFEQVMRPQGFNVQSYDPFSSPEKPREAFDLITAFEVVEHAPDPKAIFAEMLQFASQDFVLLIQTALCPDNIDRIRGSWWYMGPRNGHVSFYTKEALSILSYQFSLQFRIRNSIFLSKSLESEKAKRITDLF